MVFVAGSKLASNSDEKVRWWYRGLVFCALLSLQNQLQCVRRHYMNSTVRGCEIPDSLTRCVVSAAGVLLDIVRAHHLAYLRLGTHRVAMGEAQELEIG